MPPDSFQLGELKYTSAAPLVRAEQLRSLLMSSDDDEISGIAKEFFDLFRKESERRLLELDDVCARNDIDQFRKIIHFLAGSGGNIGMEWLLEVFHAAESDIVASKVTDVRHAAPQVRAVYKASYTEFCDIFSI